MPNLSDQIISGLPMLRRPEADAGAPLRLVACPHPFREVQEEHRLIPGQSLLEILREVQPDIHLYCAHVWVGDDYIPALLWGTIYPRPGSEITIRVVPQGPIGRAIGMVFIAIAAIAVAIIAPWALGLTGMMAGVVGGIAGMAVSIVGNLVLNALIPPTANPSRQTSLSSPAPYGGSAASSPTYSLTGGSNVANKWGPLPKIFGIHRHYPNYGAETYTEVVGNEQYLRLYFVWGLSRAYTPGIQIEDLKIGDTALANFEGVEVEHRNLRYKAPDGTSTEYGDEPLTLYSNRAHEDEEVKNILLEQGQPVVRTSQPGARELSVDISFPSLFTNDPTTGARNTKQVTFNIEYRPSGSAEPWTPINYISVPGAQHWVDTSYTWIAGNNPYPPGYTDVFFAVVCPDGRVVEKGTPITINKGYWASGTASGAAAVITAASSSAVRRGFRWAVNPAGDPDITYDVRLTRLHPGADNSFSSSQSYWTALRSFWNTDPFSCSAPVARTILRIKASNELNGTVNKFSGLCSGIEPDWDPATGLWICRITQNPASHARELCQGPHNMDPYGDDELNLPKLQYWHEYCAAQGWQYNKIVDYDVEFEELWAEIAATGRAALDWLDSKRSVIIDEPQAYTVGPAFTPRNSNNFSSQITYPDEVHCWRCAFKNELNGYQDDERLVLLDGYARLDANGDPVDAWDQVIEQQSGNLSLGKTYKILASETDYFYPGCAAGEIFTAAAATALDAANKVSLPLATIFVSLPILGVTHPDLIFKHARFHGAQMQLRFEKHQWNAHLDQLVARRGNRTKFASPVILAGLSWGRVKGLIMESIEGGDRPYFSFEGGWFGEQEAGQFETGALAGVVLDAKCPMQAGTDYAIRFRLGNNVSVLCAVETVPGLDHLTLTFSTPIPPFAPGPPPENYWPAIGDLFMFGESGKESIDLILASVRPNAQLGAQLTALAYDENIYLADQGIVPPHDPLITAPTAWWAPSVAWVRSDGSVLDRDADGTLCSRILLSLAIPGALDPKITGVEAQYWPTASNAAPVTLPVAPLEDWEVSILPVEDGVSYDFRLRYVKSDGSRGPWGETQTEVVLGKTAPPATPQGLNISQVQEQINWSWTKVPDRDVKGYVLKYGPVGGAWAAGNLVTQVMLGTSYSDPMIPPGTWDFMIKAVDTSPGPDGNGNESLLEARKTFRVMQFYLILADPLSAPNWPGTLINMTLNPGTGHLIPADQDLAAGDNFEVFDNFVVNPFATYGYEAPEIDLGADLAARAWSRSYSDLGPGETGTTEPEMEFDYKEAGGSYGGFAPWTIGPFLGRYAKFKVLHNAADGNRVFKDFQPVIDQDA